MRKSAIILCVMTYVFFVQSLAQNHSSRFGHSMAPTGTSRILIVFADVVDDTCSAFIPRWSEGELPLYKVTDKQSGTVTISPCRP